MERTSTQVLEEKKKRHEQVANEVEKRCLVERTVGDLYDWINELHCEHRAMYCSEVQIYIFLFCFKFETKLKNNSKEITFFTQPIL